MSDNPNVAVLRERIEKVARDVDPNDSFDSGMNFRQIAAELRSISAALEAQASALAYATRLAAAMHRDHYAEDAPQWEPFPDLMGVLSQIDNMLTGLARKQASAPGGEVTAEAAFEAGWITAARWAKRDDLLADIDSPAYERDRAAALADQDTGAAG